MSGAYLQKILGLLHTWVEQVSFFLSLTYDYFLKLLQETSFPIGFNQKFQETFNWRLLKIFFANQSTGISFKACVRYFLSMFYFFTEW